MVILTGSRLRESLQYVDKLVTELSEKSIDDVSRISAILVKGGKIIGKEVNGPQENAIINAIENGYDTNESTLYSAYIKDGKIFSGEKSFCAHCSRILLESGVKEVVVLEDGKFVSYKANEFYDLSFDKFIKKKKII